MAAPDRTLPIEKGVRVGGYGGRPSAATWRARLASLVGRVADSARPERLRGWGPSAVAWSAALAMLAFRFANFRNVSFIQDEPNFLAAAADQIRTGHWLSASPFIGNQGLHYGPTVLWFYGVVRLLFGGDPAMAIGAMLVCVVVSQAAFGVGLARRFGTIAGATTVAFVASSPYQFFWSRLAWDQSVDIASAWIAFAFCFFSRITPAVGALIGGVTGLAASSHLMSAPLVVVTLAFVAYGSVRDRRWLPLASALIAALAVNLPYIVYLSHHVREAAAPNTPHWALATTFFLEPARVAGLRGIQYFFDGAWGDFIARRGAWDRSAFMSPVLGVVISAVAFAGLAWSVRQRGPRRRPALFALTSWIVYAVFYASRNLATEPHYQFATWWIIPLGISAALFALRSISKGLWGGAIAGVWFIALVQMRFTVDWMDYIRERGGTQGVHYGTALALQKSAIETACDTNQPRVYIINETNVFPVSLAYISSTTTQCASKVVHFCGWDQCAREPAGRRVRIRYAEPSSGRLRVVTP